MRPSLIGFVESYGALLAVAFVLGFYLMLHEAERKGLDRSRVYWIGIATAALGLVAARAYVVVTHAPEYAGHPVDALLIWKGGTGSTGMYVGGLLGSVAAARWLAVPVGALLDGYAPSAALGVAIGRVACFLNGCCYGNISDAPLAVRFPPGSAPQVAHAAAGLVAEGAASLPVQPVQLYEAAYGLVLFAILWHYRRVPRRDGALMALFFLLYPLGRFFTEFLRGDPRTWVGPLSVPQVFSIAAALVAGGFLLRSRGQGAVRT